MRRVGSALLELVDETLNPVRPWQRNMRGRYPFGAAIGANFFQLFLVAMVVRGVMWLVGLAI